MRLATLLGTSLLALTTWSSIASATTFSYTGGLQSFTATTAGTYDIVAFGAQGGSGFSAGGLGAEIGGDFVLTAGETLQIAVGGMGSSNHDGYGGGGGGSFVVAPSSTPLVIAGGGGGGGAFMTGGGGLATTGGTGTGGTGGSESGGGGGGGFTTAGTSNSSGGGGGGGYPGLIGGGGAYGGPNGGYGGGGGGSGQGAAGGGGGGGGYSGGGGATNGSDNGGSGGTSYDTGLSNADLILLSGVNTGDGSVTITLLADTVTAVPEPATLALLGLPLGLLGLVTMRRRQGVARV